MYPAVKLLSESGSTTHWQWFMPPCRKMGKALNSYWANCSVHLERVEKEHHTCMCIQKSEVGGSLLLCCVFCHWALSICESVGSVKRARTCWHQVLLPNHSSGEDTHTCYDLKIPSSECWHSWWLLQDPLGIQTATNRQGRTDGDWCQGDHCCH